MTVNETFKLKVALLSNGIDFNIDIFEKYEGVFYENTYGYCLTNKGVSREHRFPQVLLLGNDIVASCHLRKNSPYKLKYEHNQFNIYFHNTLLNEVKLPEFPPFFAHKLSGDIESDKIISVSGAVTPGYFFYPDCFYFAEGVPCSFCSLKPTRKSVAKPLITRFSNEHITESTKLFQHSGWHIDMVTNTAGTPREDHISRKMIIEPLRRIYDALEPKVPIHILAHPPNDLKLIDEYKQAGVTSIAFNIELFDKKSFKKHCPGKDKFYGYEKWWEALDYAKEVFGEYKAFCGLIWGLEAPESSMEGAEYILSRGLGYASNVFHSDPDSLLGSIAHPSEENIMKIAEHEAGLFKKYPKAKTIYNVSMRNTLDWEIHRGAVNQINHLEKEKKIKYENN